ncbi:MAG: ABC transporter ATP-binding protein [Desulfosporosinus sp.]|nr:ABC transporter ATP-binding protein [Desulfosporosinus sp.]
MDISIANLSKSYQQPKKVLSNIDLNFQAGSFTAILGPSGCGKTTLMRCLAGFLSVDQGVIRFGDQEVTHLPPQKRGTAMVFQNYALWPHMSIYENIAYGLKIRKHSKPEIEKKILHILAKVEIDPQDVKKRYPSQYSGGQQQRIALARALVLEPKLLLMDEPLSNLDAKVRQRLRIEIRKLQKDLGITAIYVTHDQDEALSMADQMVLMNEGKIEQIGSPEEIYTHPENYFAAQFIGTSNSLQGEYQDGAYYLGQQILQLPDSPLRNKGSYDLVIRSKDARITKHRVADAKVLTFQGNLRESLFTGSGFRHWVEVEKQDIFIESEENILEKGICFVQIPHEKYFLFPKENLTCRAGKG